MSRSGPTLRLYRGLGPFAATGTTDPPATTPPATESELNAEKIMKDYGADVLTAQAASRYVGELGALAPKCAMKGWKRIRQGLIERGDRLLRFVLETAPNEIRARVLGPVKTMTDVAKSLPPAREDTPVVDLGEQWEEPDPGLGGEPPIPVPPLGKAPVELSREWCDLLRRNGVAAPAGCSDGSGTTWNDAARAWDQNRGTAFFMGYLALQPYIRAAGPTGDVIYWGGVLVYEVGSGVVGWLRDRSLSEQAVAELGSLNELHIRFMQDELRAIYRQIRATHRIAMKYRKPEDQVAALKASDPHDEPEMPPIWDGTFPDLDKSSSRLPWWVLVVLGVGGVGAMAALED